MLIVGITGGIATGKSYITKLFKQKHITIISSDTIYNDLLLFNQKCIQLIKESFPDAYNKEKNYIDKLALQKICQTSNNLTIIETISHPFIAKERKKLIERAIRNREKIILLEIPLLFEKNLEHLCDKIILIYSNPQLQFLRYKKRQKKINHQDNDDILKKKFHWICQHQKNVRYKIHHSDFFINTNMSYQDVYNQFIKIYNKLRGLNR